MPYHIDWLSKNQVIQLRLWGHLSPTEIRTAYDALVVHYQQGISPLFLLVDHTDVNRYPVGLNNYDFFIAGQPATKFQQVLIVGPSRQIRFLIRLFARVRQVETRSFETEQEALAVLHQHNATLPDANTQ